MVTSELRQMTTAERAALPERLRKRIIMSFKEMLGLAGCAVVAVTVAYAFLAVFVIVVGSFFGLPRQFQGYIALSVLGVLLVMVALSGIAMLKGAITQRRRYANKLRHYSASTEVREITWSGRYWFGVILEDDQDSTTDEDEPEDEADESGLGDISLLVSPGSEFEEWIVARPNVRGGIRFPAPDAALVLTDDGYAFLSLEESGTKIEPELIHLPIEDDTALEQYFDNDNAPPIELISEAEMQPDIRDAVIARLEEDPEASVEEGEGLDPA